MIHHDFQVPDTPQANAEAIFGCFCWGVVIFREIWDLFISMIYWLISSNKLKMKILSTERPLFT